MYIKLKPFAETLQRVSLPTDREDSRAWLKAAYQEIECDLIEICPTRYPGIVLIIDEEGKMKDSLLNDFASWLYNNPFDCIVGTALIASTKGERIVSLDAYQEALINKAFNQYLAD